MRRIKHKSFATAVTGAIHPVSVWLVAATFFAFVAACDRPAGSAGGRRATKQGRTRSSISRRPLRS